MITSKLSARCTQFVRRAFVLFFFSFFCVSSYAEKSSQKHVTLLLKNETGFSCLIQRGFYGGALLTSLSPYEEKSVEVSANLNDDEEIIFYYYFALDYLSLRIEGLQSAQQYFVVKPSEKNRTVSIRTPQNLNFTQTGIIIHNKTDAALSLTRENSYIEFYQSGKSLGISMPATSYASFIKSARELSSTITVYNSSLALPKLDYRAGYVYIFDYDGKTITLQDARPIQFISEKLWHKDFAKSELVQNVRQIDGKTYLIGSEELFDTRKNRYSSGFLRCLDRSGSELWKQSYALKGKDTYFYDFLPIDEKTLVVVGQTILEDYAGLIVCYDLDGKLLKSLTVAETIGFDKIEKSSDGTVIVLGYDTEGDPVTYSLSDDFELTKIVSKQNAASYFEFVQEVSAEVYDSEGNLYSAGESAQMEQPVACVAKTAASNGKSSVLYSATEPFSYITDIKINQKTNELLICGYLNAKNEVGNGGTPFIRCLDAKSGKVLWENIFKNVKYELAVKIAACEDYGFVVVLANVDDEGQVCAPCTLVRTNAVGKAEF